MDDAQVNPKRTGVKATLVPEYRHGLPPGACTYDAGTCRLQFACPGCGLWGGVRCGHPKPAPSPSWDIVSGEPSKPETLTLSPSIHCIGCCGWHGYLRAGVFESC